MSGFTCFLLFLLAQSHMLFFLLLFLSGLVDIILQDTDSEVLNLLDPSSPEIVVGNISLACSVEVWTTRQLPFSDLLVETVTTILL